MRMALHGSYMLRKVGHVNGDVVARAQGDLLAVGHKPGQGSRVIAQRGAQASQAVAQIGQRGAVVALG